MEYKSEDITYDKFDADSEKYIDKRRWIPILARSILQEINNQHRVHMDEDSPLGVSMLANNLDIKIKDHRILAMRITQIWLSAGGYGLTLGQFIGKMIG